MSSRSLDDLCDSVRQAAVDHIQLCASEGIDLLIYCTLRSGDEQKELYAQGRTTKGAIITNARAGESAHNPDKDGKAHAYDCCPMIGGKPMWDSKHKAWQIVIKNGELAGLVASARWAGKLKEQAHFQDKHWKKP